MRPLQAVAYSHQFVKQHYVVPCTISHARRTRYIGPYNWRICPLVPILCMEYHLLKLIPLLAGSIAHESSVRERTTGGSG